MALVVSYARWLRWLGVASAAGSERPARSGYIGWGGVTPCRRALLLWVVAVVVLERVAAGVRSAPIGR